VNWSPHSIEQYVSRIREMPLDDARRELSRLLATAVVTRERPEWLPDRGAHAFMRVGDDIALPLWKNERGELVAATVLIRNMPPSESDRERTSARRRTARAGKRASRLAQKHRGGRRYLAPVLDHNA
jgi:hypothetical protein